MVGLPVVVRIPQSETSRLKL